MTWEGHGSIASMLLTEVLQGLECGLELQLVGGGGAVKEWGLGTWGKSVRVGMGQKCIFLTQLARVAGGCND